jgi:hypothetical protein
MYYLTAIFVVILVYSIYAVWATYYTCTVLVTQLDCIEFGFFYYIDYQLELSILRLYGREDIVNVCLIPMQTLIALETIVFYFLFTINLSSLVYLYYMEKKEKLETHSQKFATNAVILGNLP